MREASCEQWDYFQTHPCCRLVSPSSPVVAVWYSVAWPCRGVYIPLLAGGDVSYSQVMVMADKAAVNVLVEIFGGHVLSFLL